MLKKFARWVLREELKTLKEELEWTIFVKNLWKGRYQQLGIQVFGVGFSPFPTEEFYQGKQI